MSLYVRLLFIVFLLTRIFPASGQETNLRKITGTVSATDSKLPLQGVTVLNRVTGKKTLAGERGDFTIEAAHGHYLEFTSVGYLKFVVNVDDRSSYTIQLELSASQLGEVVISHGIKRTGRALGYSTQQVSGKELAPSNRENFLSSLQGRVSGAIVTPTSGVPGASTQIILRGPVSFDGNNQPLLVVDGLPISNRTLNQGNLVVDHAARDNDYSNRGIDINPDDIENVTILTGPEAAALYGTDGASGVILITTKRAKAGTARISYGTSLTVSARPKMPSIQRIYDQGAGGIINNTSRTYFGPHYEPGAKLYDNVNSFFDVAFSQKHDLSIEGGSEKVSFRLSPSFSRYNGNVPTTRFDRASIRLASNAQLSPSLKVDASLTYINSFNRKGSKGANSYYLSALTWPSDDDMTKFVTDAGNRRKIGGSATENDNPFWDIKKNINTDKTNHIMGNLVFMFTPAPFLNFTARLGADIYTTHGNRLYHPQSNTGSGTNGVLENYVENSTIYNGTFVVNLNKTFGAFDNSLSVGFNFDENTNKVESYKGERFLIPDFNSINNTDVATQRSFLTSALVRKFGYFGNYNIGYKKLLYLSLTGRLDASSTLLPNDPYFFYPGAGLSFLFSELMKDFSWLEYGKLRVNAAFTGKDPRRPYLTGDRLVAQLSNGGGLALDVTLGNAALKAEFLKTIELGTELKFLNDRIAIDFTWYYNEAIDQITAPRLSYATGGVLAYLNSGRVENKGIQLQISGFPVKNDNFSWRSIVNFSKNKNKITAVPAGLSTFYISNTNLYAGVRGEFNLGGSISSLSSMGYLRNKNGDIVISPATGLPVRDANYIVRGDRQPDFTMGLVNQFSFKNFSLSFLIDIRKGGDIFNGNELFLTVQGLSQQTLDRERPRVIQGVLQDGLENSDNPTPNNIVVVPHYTNGYYTAAYSEEDYIEKDINWLRLQDISLSYTVNPRFFKGRFIKGAEIGLAAANLFMITNYTGVDPSVSGLNASEGGYGGTGIDYATLPSARTITLNLNFRF